MSKEQVLGQKITSAKVVFGFCMVVGLLIVPGAYGLGWLSIETVNMLGRYMTFAIVAVGLDLLWGYAGILSLCQATFFCLGGYAMGIYLAHHGGPEGITDRLGWKVPACLYVVYPYQVGEVPEDALVPWFWKPFFNLPLTMLLAVALPGAVAFVIGVFCFRSRVRGVYFAILTQAIAVAVFLFFQRNEVKFGGTNGLTRFEQIGSWESVSSFGPSNLIENSSFARRGHGWHVSEGGAPKFKTGCEFSGIERGTVSRSLASPLKAGVEYSGFFNVVGLDDVSQGPTCRILTKDSSGDIRDTVALRPIPLRGKKGEVEYRAEFRPDQPITQVTLEVSLGERGGFVLRDPRIFRRYSSQAGGVALSHPRLQLVLYGLTVLSLAAVYCLCGWAVRSRFGRVLLAVRDDEPTLRFFGYKPWAYKLLAFVIAAMCAGWGGMLYAPQMKIITPYDMEPARSILVVIWVAVGGRGTLAGAIIGALSVNLLYDYLTSEHDYGIFVWKAEYWQFVLGGLFVGVVLLFPQGLIRFWYVLRDLILGGRARGRAGEGE